MAELRLQQANCAALLNHPEAEIVFVNSERAAGKLLDVALYQDFPGENRVEVRQGQQREEHDAAQDGQILFEGFLTG